MPHFLFRPHIHIDQTVLTIDFLIRSVGLIDSNGTLHAVPVDLLNCHVDLQYQEDTTLVAPASFHFVGDENRYEAPAFCLLDRAVFEQNPSAAWRNSRVSVARFAIPSGSRTSASFSNGADNELGPVPLDHPAAKRTAIVQALAESEALAKDNDTISVSLSGSSIVTHVCKMLLLDEGDQR